MSPFLLIDSNILIYSLEITSPKNLLAQKFLQTTPAFIAHQNILETYRVITHKKYPSPFHTTEAVSVLRKMTDHFEVLYPTSKTQEIFLKLVEKYNISGLHTFDTSLVATMLSHGITTLATDNVRDFQKFSEIRVLNPFAQLAVHENPVRYQGKQKNSTQ